MSTNFLSVSNDFIIKAQRASEGGAMYDEPARPSSYPWPNALPTRPSCFKLSAPPVIIDDLSMGIDAAIAHVNTVFRVNGDQPALPTHVGLEGDLA